MTHLRIEQNNITENVTTGIISKLYQYAKEIKDYEEANDIEASQVSLKGNLAVAKAYADDVTYLTNKFPDLHITAQALYMKFADPEVERVLISTIGDGTGVTLDDTRAYTSTDPMGFQGNTTITQFNELGQMTTITTIANQDFDGCTNLRSIDLSNILYIRMTAFRNCGLTGVINLPNIISISPTSGNASNAFQGCNNITEVHLGENLQSISGSGCFYGCTSLTTVTGLSNLTSLPTSLFNGCSSLQSIDVNLSNITIAESRVFQDCRVLPLTVDLSNFTQIKNYSFYQCGQMTFTGTTINTSKCGESCFASDNATLPYCDLSNLSSIIVDPTTNSNTCPDGIFKCAKIPTTITISSNMTVIPKELFRQVRANGPITVTGGDNVTEIKNHAFSSNKFEGLLSFPNIQKVNSYVFQQSSDNLIVDLGSSLTSIPWELFHVDWRGTLIMRCTSVPTFNTTPTTDVRQYRYAKIYVPDASVNLFKADPTWGLLPEGVILPLSQYTPPSNS